MSSFEPFKWKHFQPDVILLNVHWYCRYNLSFRDLEEMMAERGISVDHSTIHRWVLQYAPEIDSRCRSHLSPTSSSWRVDETFIKVKRGWRYLYRAVDHQGNTLDFLLAHSRDADAAERFFRKALNASHTQTPEVINVDRLAIYPCAVRKLHKDGTLPANTELRQVKFLNNILEQDHRRIKRLISIPFGFRTFDSAQRTLQGYEAIAMIRKGQVKGIPKGDVTGQISFIHNIFGVAA